MHYRGNLSMALCAFVALVTACGDPGSLSYNENNSLAPEPAIVQINQQALKFTASQKDRVLYAVERATGNRTACGPANDRNVLVNPFSGCATAGPESIVITAIGTATSNLELPDFDPMMDCDGELGPLGALVADSDFAAQGRPPLFTRDGVPWVDAVLIIARIDEDGMCEMLPVAFPCPDNTVLRLRGPSPNRAWCAEDVECELPADCDDGNPCTDDRCAANGACVFDPNPGRACDDANPCTLNDTCDAFNACVAGAPMACEDRGQCFGVNACNPDTGECEAIALADGAGCDDANACTAGDTCQAGACAPGAPTVCADEECRDFECNPATGECEVFLVAPDSVVCDDDNACTEGDECLNGTCSGAEMQCNPGQCEAAACVDQNGQPACFFAALADGTACDGGSGQCISGECQADRNVCNPDLGDRCLTRDGILSYYRCDAEPGAQWGVYVEDQRCGPADDPLVACFPGLRCSNATPCEDAGDCGPLEECGPNGTCEPLDSDQDGTPDAADNCPLRANAGQEDRDGDGRGDVCDNCPDDANANQSDRDGDGRGDVCDTEANAGDCADGLDNDGDGLLDCADPVCAALPVCAPGPACENDAGCPEGQFCGAGVCMPVVDARGRTGLNQSGANGGPLPDGNPDNFDADGDCYCAVGPCVDTSAAPGVCPELFGGDCDDTGTGFANNPGSIDWPGDRFDNDCDGLIDEVGL